MTIFASLISKFEIMKAQIISFLLGFSLGISAQETYINEVMTQEDATSETWEETYEQLCELSQHPLDINSATLIIQLYMGLGIANLTIQR